MIHTNNIHRKFKEVWPEYNTVHIIVVCAGLVDLFELKKDDSYLEVIKKNWTLVCEKLKLEYQS